MVESLNQMSSDEVTALKAKLEILEEENEGLIHQLQEMSHLDDDLPKLRKGWQKKLLTCDAGLEEEAGALRAIIGKKV